MDGIGRQMVRFLVPVQGETPLHFKLFYVFEELSECGYCVGCEESMWMVEQSKFH